MYLEDTRGENMGEKSPAVGGAGGSHTNNGNSTLGDVEADSTHDESGTVAPDLEVRQEGGGEGNSSEPSEPQECVETSEGDGTGRNDESIPGNIQESSDLGKSMGETSSTESQSAVGGKAGASDVQSRSTGIASSGGAGGGLSAGVGPLFLPWGARKDRGTAGAGTGLLGLADMDARPGEFVMRTLFAEFTIQAEKKIEAVMAEPPVSKERPISKSLQRGEDLQFDQLLCAFGSVAEHCLPSLLRALFAWYDRQVGTPPEFQQFRSHHHHHHRTPASTLLSPLPISTSSTSAGVLNMSSSSSLGSPVPSGSGSTSGSSSGMSSTLVPAAPSSSPGPHHQEMGAMKRVGKISGASVIGGLSAAMGEANPGDKPGGAGACGVVSVPLGVGGNSLDKSSGEKGDSGLSGGSVVPNTNMGGAAAGSGSVHSGGGGGVEEEQRRTLAVEFLFCLALIEVLKQLPFHPGQDDLVAHVENLSFAHFKYREGLQSGPNAGNIHMIADLYAEVIGGLAQSRFNSVRKRFMTELAELRAREPGPHTTQSIISLLMGMKFFSSKDGTNRRI